MKSYALIALFFVLIAKLAYAQVQPPVQPTYINPVEKAEYEKEQAIIKAQAYQVKPTVPQVQPVQPAVQPAQPAVQPAVQPAQPAVQPAQPAVQPAVQPVKPAIQPAAPQVKPAQPAAPQEIHPADEIESHITTEEQGGSSHIGGIALTGVAVALIIGAGYKNHKKDLKFKMPELPAFVTAKEANTTREVAIEMEVLLSETSDAENYSLAKNRAYKCMIAWTPKQADEIILRRGDLVCVKECFNDGYTLGRNLSTKFDGIFPTCCLCRPEQNVIGSELVVNGKFTAIPKRVNSKKCQERRAKRASRGVSFLSVPGWNKSGFTSLSL